MSSPAWTPVMDAVIEILIDKALEAKTFSPSLTLPTVQPVVDRRAEALRALRLAGEAVGCSERTWERYGSGFMRRGDVAQQRARAWRWMREQFMPADGRRLSFPEIAQATGGCHSTVIGAIQRLKREAR